MQENLSAADPTEGAYSAPPNPYLVGKGLDVSTPPRSRHFSFGPRCWPKFIFTIQNMNIGLSCSSSNHWQTLLNFTADPSPAGLHCPCPLVESIASLAGKVWHHHSMHDLRSKN